MKFQKISIPTPREVNRNPRGRVVSKAQFFKGKYGTKMEFPKGVGYQVIKSSVEGGVWIFSATTHSCCSLPAETFHINITIIRTVLSIAEAYSVNIIFWALLNFKLFCSLLH